MSEIAEGAAVKVCAICGETRFKGWLDCPACGHPYPDDDRDGDDTNEDDDEDDEDDE